MPVYANDKELRMIAQRLFQELKKNAAKGAYVSFNPHNIEIIGSGNIRFKDESTATDLRGALRSLGVTLYHLATGKSEINNPVLRNDPNAYKPIESELWPAISLMLSGESFNLPDLEKRLKGDSLAKKSWDNIAPARKWLKENFFWLLGLLLFPLVLCRRFLRGFYRLLINDPAEIFFWFCILFSMSFGFCYLVYHWHFYSLGRTISTLLIYWMLCGFTIGITASVIIDEFNDVRDYASERLVVSLIQLGLCLVWTGLLIMLFFWRPVYNEFHPDSKVNISYTGIRNNPIIVSRDTGDLAYRLGYSNHDTFLVYEGGWINLFKFKVIEGLPVSGEISQEVLPDLKLSIKYGFETKDEYESACQKWPNQFSLENAIRESMNQLLPGILEKIREIQKTGESGVLDDCQLNIAWTGDISEDFKIQIEADLRKNFNDILNKYAQEQSKLKLKQALQPLAEELRSGLVAVFGEYFSSLEVNFDNQAESQA